MYVSAYISKESLYSHTYVHLPDIAQTKATHPTAGCTSYGPAQQTPPLRAGYIPLAGP